MHRLVPPLRWAGGKTWLRDLLVQEIRQVNPARYIEPFVGAGAILLGLVRLSQAHFIASDASEPLINLWHVIQTAPDQLAKLEAELFEVHGNTKTGFYTVRQLFNLDGGEPIVRAAQMRYLNAISFNGLWRVNARDKFNVPFGDVANPRALTIGQLRALSMAIQRVSFRCCDFREILRNVSAGDAIYADPPYDEGFVGYTKDGFDRDDQRELAALLHAADQQGAHIWASNVDTPHIREIYDWAEIIALDEDRNIAAKVASRKPSRCVLIRSRT